MRRRVRIDLGQPLDSKGQANLERKRQRWEARNKDKPQSENPFLVTVETNNLNGNTEDPNELRARLKNLEYGNFPGYFNYRNNNKDSNCDSKDSSQDCEKDTTKSEAITNGTLDERLSLLKAEWFTDKDVLDVGCNRGHITYAIAKLHSPRLILGVDIDLGMINLANKEINAHSNDQTLHKTKFTRQRLQASLKVGSSSSTDQDPDEQPDGHIGRSISGSPGVEHSLAFPNNLFFIEHDYVLHEDDLVDKQEPFFDTILCLSVTKWIHLNYRDDGLKRFFKRMYRHLRKDGLLILEPQPFDNYGRRKKLSDRLRANFYSIQFKPEHFDQYLLSPEIGFREIVYEATTDHKFQGFRRPFKVYRK